MLLIHAQTVVTAKLYDCNGIGSKGDSYEGLSRQQLEAVLIAKGYRPTKEEDTTTGNIKVIYRDGLGASVVITFKRLNNGR